MSDGFTKVCPISKFRFAVNSLNDECKMRNSVLSSLIFSLFCIIHLRMSETHAVILLSHLGDLINQLKSKPGYHPHIYGSQVYDAAIWVLKEASMCRK